MGCVEVGRGEKEIAGLDEWNGMEWKRGEVGRERGKKCWMG